MPSSAPTFDAYGFRHEQQLALAEVVNIAFGHAVAPLSDLLGYMNLSVPKVAIIGFSRLKETLTQLTADEPVYVVHQTFRPEFRGQCVLVLPATATQTLRSLLLIDDPADDSADDSADDPHRDSEIVLEVANILTGATIGKLSELLGTHTTFSPPALALENRPVHELLLEPEQNLVPVILINTFFAVEGKPEASGYLYILVAESSVRWMSQALDRFVEGA